MGYMASAASPFKQGLSTLLHATKKKEPQRGRPPSLLTDEQIANIRWLHENKGRKAHTLAKDYGTSVSYMSRILAYEYRWRIDPSPPSEPSS
jgi:hypothetical protein